jgi:hypothetical protein
MALWTAYKSQLLVHEDVLVDTCGVVRDVILSGHFPLRLQRVVGMGDIDEKHMCCLLEAGPARS